MRWGRSTGWFAGVVLPLVVCAGLFVMHGLDDPSTHRTGAAHVVNDHAGSDHAAQATGSPVAHVAGVAGAIGSPVGRVVSDHAESGTTGCTDCMDAVHVAMACLAVLAAAVVLALSWCGARLVALARLAGERGRAVVVSTRESRARPAWIQFGVMLC